MYLAWFGKGCNPLQSGGILGARFGCGVSYVIMNMAILYIQYVWGAVFVFIRLPPYDLFLNQRTHPMAIDFLYIWSIFYTTGNRLKIFKLRNWPFLRTKMSLMNHLNHVRCSVVGFIVSYDSCPVRSGGEEEFSNDLWLHSELIRDF